VDHFVPFQCSMMCRPAPGVPRFALPPTAQQLDAAVHAMPFRALMGQRPGLGVASGVHAVPFQRVAEVLPESPPVALKPTAMHAGPLVHQMPSSPDGRAGGPSSEMDQAVPFHCCARIPLGLEPTAVHAESLAHETPLSMLCDVPEVGVVTFDHAVPFQCAVSVPYTAPEAECQVQTAQQLLAWGQETPAG
jgi:hypothetical protein